MTRFLKSASGRSPLWARHFRHFGVPGNSHAMSPISLSPVTHALASNAVQKKPAWSRSVGANEPAHPPLAASPYLPSLSFAPSAPPPEPPYAGNPPVRIRARGVRRSVSLAPHSSQIPLAHVANGPIRQAKCDLASGIAGGVTALPKIEHQPSGRDQDLICQGIRRDGCKENPTEAGPILAAIPPHLLPPNWLISRRMAEISHSSFRNFSPPSEFK